jgi:hypothetical protein
MSSEYWTTPPTTVMSMIRRASFGLVILGVTGIGGCRATEQNEQDTERLSQPSVEATTFGRNASFTVNGTLVTLVDGVASAPIENSSASTTTRYLGNEAEGDLNGDGLQDLAFWVTQESGGSGTFYYVVVALKNAGGYTATNAFRVGDRITPQSLQIRSDARELHVNFAERKRGEPMTTPPTEAAVLLLKVTPDGVLKGLMS